MNSTVDNPYNSPKTDEAEGRRKSGAAFSSRAMRFATLGVLAGIGFGFVILAMTARFSFERRSLDDAYFTSDYVTPLFTFAFWSITTGAFFGVVVSLIGFVADVWVPSHNANRNEPSDPTESPVNGDFES